MNDILKVKNLTKSYPTKTGNFIAVNDISFSACRGEVLGILGPNGSGKTTTLKSIAALTSINQGEILIEGFDNHKYREDILFRIGALLKGARNIYWRMSVLENIIYFAGIKGIRRNEAIKWAEYLIDILLLTDQRNKEVRKLSKGMQQKVAIACAIVHQPSLVLMVDDLKNKYSPKKTFTVSVADQLEAGTLTALQQSGDWQIEYHDDITHLIIME